MTRARNTAPNNRPTGLTTSNAEGRERKRRGSILSHHSQKRTKEEKGFQSENKPPPLLNHVEAPADGQRAWEFER